MGAITLRIIRYCVKKHGGLLCRNVIAPFVNPRLSLIILLAGIIISQCCGNVVSSKTARNKIENIS